MLKLKKLSLKNIGRFTENQEIDFTALGSLIQVDAQNINTGASSGSGKSTIFNAISWTLGLDGLPTTILQSRLTDEPIHCSLELDWNGKSVVVDRGKKLTISIDGIETKGASKITEEKLDEILGLPRNLFRPLIHKRQGEQGFFLNMTPAKMNEFLTDCLGLNDIRSKIEIVYAKSKILDQELGLAQLDLTGSQSALDATLEALESIGSPPAKPTADLSHIDALKECLANYKKVLLDNRAAQNQEKISLERNKPQLEVADFDKKTLNEILEQENDLEGRIGMVKSDERDRQAQKNKDISDLKSALAQKLLELKHEFENKINKAKMESNDRILLLSSALAIESDTVKIGKASRESAQKIMGQLKHLRSGICHVCEQTWITDASKLEESKLLEELNQHKANIMASGQASEKVDILKLSIEDAKVELTTRTAGINKDYSANQVELRKSIESQISVLTEEARYRISEEELSLIKKLNDVRELLKQEQTKECEYLKNQTFKNQIALEEFLLEQKRLNDKHVIENTRIQDEISKLEQEEYRATAELRTYSENLDRYNRQLFNLKAQELDHKLKADKANAKTEEIAKKLGLSEEVKRCLKSYLSCSFDDALDSISSMATTILRAVPTMANATIRLEGVKETGSGALKEQINACLDNDGELNVPVKSLSGGERSAVDLSIDLAVASFITERTNIGADFLLLDEIMNGFDTLGKENTLDMIKGISGDRKVLIVEHDPVAKEYILDRITVVRDGETSFIKNSP